MADTRAGTAKVIQYLNEAYGTEQRLETALEAHISMTTKDSYRKRLREHLTETKRHAREVEKRVKQLQDPDYLERLARECLGMVMPGDIAFVSVPKGSKTGSPSC